MTIALIGSFTLAALNPNVTAPVATMIGDLTARAEGAAQAAAGLVLVPPSLATQLASTVELVAQITLAISVGVPSVSVQLDALLTLIVDLEAQLAILLEFQSLLTAGGVEVYTFEGECRQLAPQLGSFTNGGFAGGTGSTPGYALVLSATDAGTWAAILGLYGL